MRVASAILRPGVLSSRRAIGAASNMSGGAKGSRAPAIMSKMQSALVAPCGEHLVEPSWVQFGAQMVEKEPLREGRREAGDQGGRTLDATWEARASERREQASRRSSVASLSVSKLDPCPRLHAARSSHHSRAAALESLQRLPPRRQRHHTENQVPLSCSNPRYSHWRPAAMDSLFDDHDQIHYTTQAAFLLP